MQKVSSPHQSERRKINIHKPNPITIQKSHEYEVYSTQVAARYLRSQSSKDRIVYPTKYKFCVPAGQPHYRRLEVSTHRPRSLITGTLQVNAFTLDTDRLSICQADQTIRRIILQELLTFGYSSRFEEDSSAGKSLRAMFCRELRTEDRRSCCQFRLYIFQDTIPSACMFNP
ncbi:hypothetical protein ABKN59_011244 [Abortiporus biennis]